MAVSASCPLSTADYGRRGVPGPGRVGVSIIGHGLVSRDSRFGRLMRGDASNGLSEPWPAVHVFREAWSVLAPPGLSEPPRAQPNPPTRDRLSQRTVLDLSSAQATAVKGPMFPGRAPLFPHILACARSVAPA